MRADRLLVIGCSAGGFEALLRLLPCIEATSELAVACVLHRPKKADISYAEVLGARARLPMKEAEDKEPITKGVIYVAPADYHLLVNNDKTFSLSIEEPVHYSRPSIDVLFESAAHVYRRHCTGVLLTGSNADGAEGLKSINDGGGTTIIEDPGTAQFPEMPQAALNIFTPTSTLSLEFIEKLFRRWNDSGASHESIKSFIGR